MIEALAARHSTGGEGYRVMAPVAVEESQRAAGLAHFHLDVVGDPHSQHVTVERDALLIIIDLEEHVAQTHRAGDESRDRARGVERALEAHQGPVIGFACDTARLDELDQLDYAPRFGFSAGARAYLDARG